MTPEEIVQKFEAAFRAQDIELIEDLFDPEVVVYWNGKKLFEGREQAVEFERKGMASWTDFKNKVTFRAATGDMIAVELEISFIPKDGEKRVEIYGAQIWKIRDNRLVEWKPYMTVYTDE